jgi:ArsR family transcriptional regulator
MEQMEILGSYLDDRRRKYYYLTRDITVEVSYGDRGEGKVARAVPAQAPGWQSTLTLVRRMIRAREELVTNLEQLDQDIQQKITDLARQGGDLVPGEEELDLILALSQADLTLDELQEFMDLGRGALLDLLGGLMEKGIVERGGPGYRLRGIDEG